MKISLNLFGSVWVFDFYECDVIGAIVKRLCFGFCLFGLNSQLTITENIVRSKGDDA